MTVGFRNSSAVDLDSLFMPYQSGTKAGTTGFRRSDGVDLCDIYQPYTLGAQQAACGFRNSGGTDMSSLFQHIGVPLFTVSVLDYSRSWSRSSPVTIGVYLNNDGSVSITATGTSTNTSSWGTPTGGTPGTGYWAYIDAWSDAGDFGQALGGNLNAWYQISSGAAYCTLWSGSGAGSWSQRKARIRVATDSGGSNVISTNYSILFAEYIN